MIGTAALHAVEIFVPNLTLWAFVLANAVTSVYERILARGYTHVLTWFLDQEPAGVGYRGEIQRYSFMRRPSFGIVGLVAINLIPCNVVLLL